MSDYIVVKNIKSPRSDVHITDDVIDENIDYSLMLDVSLYEERVKKGTGEESDTTFIFQPTGQIRLINHARIQERVNTKPEGEAPSV